MGEPSVSFSTFFLVFGLSIARHLTPFFPGLGYTSDLWVVVHPRAFPRTPGLCAVLPCLPDASFQILVAGWPWHGVGGVRCPAPSQPSCPVLLVDHPNQPVARSFCLLGTVPTGAYLILIISASNIQIPNSSLTRFQIWV